MPPITHPTGFRAVLPLPIHPQLDADAFPYLLGGSGDLIRVYDISSLEEPEFIREVEGHWHDVTHLRVWLRDRKEGKGKEVWIVSASLDGTLRKWRLAGKQFPSRRASLWADCVNRPIETTSKAYCRGTDQCEENSTYVGTGSG